MAEKKSFPQFTYNGKTYEVVDPTIYVPKIGERTAKEICVDVAAQEALVEKGRGGESIREVKVAEKKAKKSGEAKDVETAAGPEVESGDAAPEA